MKTSTIERVLDAASHGWRTTHVIAGLLSVARRTADQHLRELANAGRVEHRVERVGRGRGTYLSLWRRVNPNQPLYESPAGCDIMPLIEAFNGFTYRRYNG